MLSELDRRPMIGNSEGSFGDDLENEIGLLLREQHSRQEADELERELNLYRSDSAPPTVEGSLSAVGGLFGGGAAAGTGGSFAATLFSAFAGAKNGNGFASEEELRSDPAYHSYYYSNVNLNPRLPTPLLSKEDWKFAQRLKGENLAIGGVGERRKANRADNGSSRSLFSMPPGFDSRKQENEVEVEKVHSSADWGGDGLIGLSGVGLGSKQKSLAENLQCSREVPSRPASRNAFDENFENVGSAEPELAHLRRQLTSADPLRSSGSGLGLSAVHNIGPPSSYTYAVAVGASISRSITPDPQVVARAPTPCPTPIGGGRVGNSEKRNINGPSTFGGGSSGVSGSDDLVATLSGMNLSSNGVIDEDNQLASQIEQDVGNHQNYLFGLQDGQNHIKQQAYLKKSASDHLHMPSSKSNGSTSVLQKSSVPSNNSYLKGSPTSALNGCSSLPSQYQHVDGANASFSNYGLSGYPTLANMMPSHLVAGNLPLFTAGISYPTMDRSFLGNSYMNLLELQIAYLGALLSPQKSQYGVPLGAKPGSSDLNGFYGNTIFGAGMSYPGSPLASAVIPNSPVGPGSPIRHTDLNMCFPFGMRNLAGGVMGPWHLDSGCNVDESFASSLLEDFKSNKIKCFELSELAGHVVEFRYACSLNHVLSTTEEKTMVYEEIMPHALALMTDVFGNYVIQKFFEHGLPSQRRELAGKLFGHVLTRASNVWVPGDPEASVDSFHLLISS
ncbi:Pumilio 2 isoform 2 [Hibiscus syriacus]|uniref:Pumilio 2 isoform 2 n=1 Tax=Hibiscus syriacus TaxID=106335 RepID=A0A6A2ZYQ6_HIBSY|nr:Pumilio 2 isoform 2 [Hibiscus syriacus]